MTEYEKEILRLKKKEVDLLEKQAADSKAQARRDKYNRLKAAGKLSMRPAMGRGMPTVPTYEQWDGLSSDESDEQWVHYNKDSERL